MSALASLGAVARVGPSPVVVEWRRGGGAGDWTIAPIKFVEVNGVRSVPSAARVLGHPADTSTRALAPPLSPTPRIELGDGANAAASQRCNRRDVAYDDGADRITVPSVSNPARSNKSIRPGSPVLLRSHRGALIDRGDGVRRGIDAEPLRGGRKAVRDLAPHRGTLPGIGTCTMAPFFHPWRDQHTGRDPNNSHSIRCDITRAVADRVMVPVGRAGYGRGSCTGIESASLPVFRSM